MFNFKYRTFHSGLFALLFVLCACSKQQESVPGLCLSFDDRSIGQWYDLAPLLDSAGAKVTFFVTQFDSLDSAEISMLKDLELRGHEIGCHGALHVLSEKYIKENSYKDYLEKEVDSAITTMNKYGFKPKSFAYPYGAKYWFTDYLLLKKFDVLRSVEPINPTGDLSLIDDIYYEFDGDRKISAVGIDHSSQLKREMITKAIARAHAKKEVLILYGHAPSTASDTSAYTFDVNLLRFILKEASRNNLTYFKVDEL